MTDLTCTVAVPRIDIAVAAGRDAELLDERTFYELYARTAKPLRAYVVRTRGLSTDADDIVQETYLRLLRRPLPTRDMDELRAYAFKIASRLIVDHWRAHQRESSDVMPAATATGPDQALRLDVGRVFAKLKPRERQIVWLAHVEGTDHREIAATLGLRVGSIRVLLLRARRHFARLLREGGHERGTAR